MRFLFVDRILEIERGKRARAIKNVAMSEDFLTHHFPGTPIMPGALIVESALQLAGWILRDASDFQTSCLPVAFERARFFELVRPGDQLEIEVRMLESTGETARCAADISCQGKRVASGRFELALVPTEELEPIEEAQAMFALLYAPALKRPLPVGGSGDGP